ncbi:MAG: hypothetical protein JW730_07155 [Anaerolineales bacterium]|nr:hypothetical protein [Anaerolineales bacterium]
MTSTPLNDYVCCVASLRSENNATLKVRAYKKHDPLQCFDIVFFSTTYIHIPFIFEAPILETIQKEELAQVLANLSDGLQRAVSLFRFGRENSKKYIVSLSYSVEQPVLDEDWTPPSRVANRYEWSVNKFAKETLSEISFFYLNSMRLNDGSLYLSITATNSKDKRYHLYCQDVRYLQTPTISACEPFQIADRDDAAHLANKIGLDVRSNVGLLTTLAQNVPVQILCSNFLISPIPNS